MNSIYEVLTSSLFADQLNEAVTIIRELHHFVMFYLVQIFAFVVHILVSTYNEFNLMAGVGKEEITEETLTLRDMMFNSRHASHSTSLEIFWTIIPSCILVSIAMPSFSFLYYMDDVYFPDITIKAIGHQWYWSYEYSDFPWNIAYDSNLIYESELLPGELRLLQTDTNLVVPHEIDVRLIVTSLDVLHSFSIPAMGIKIDAAPGRLNQVPLAVDINYVGTLYGQCSELCGVNHGFMPIVVDVVDYEDYMIWLKSNTIS